jgi:hypothetical protein
LLSGNGKNQPDVVFQRWHQKTCFLTPLACNQLIFGYRGYAPALRFTCKQRGSVTAKLRIYNFNFKNIRML